MVVNPRAIIITVPKVPKVEGGFVQSDIVSSSISSHVPVLNMNSVQKSDNRLLLPPADSLSTISDRRKRRLNHLSFEEKLHRKKLKNRVAAQTSRDRKKARMDDLEKTNQTLQDQNAKLVAECAILRLENAHLTETNKRLEKEVVDRVPSTNSCCCCSAKLTTQSDTPHTPGPAESYGSLPLLKGWGLWIKRSWPLTGMTTIVRIWLSTSAIFHPFLTCWRILTNSKISAAWRNWQRACLKMHKVLLRLEVLNPQITLRWWGKHQKTWKPLEHLLSNYITVQLRIGTMHCR